MGRRRRGKRGGGDVASPPQWKRTSQGGRALLAVTLEGFSPSICFCQVGLGSYVLAFLFAEPINIYGVSHRHTNTGAENKFGKYWKYLAKWYIPEGDTI